MGIGSHIGVLDLALLLLAGLGAGVIGSTAGLASLISYPALLALGLPAVTANVTNTVGLIGSSIGSVSGSRRELRGQGPDIRRWLPAALAGGATGAALLLLGPPGTFQRLVPYLVGGASLLLLMSPKLRTLRNRRASAPTDPQQNAPARRRPGIQIGLFLTCLYGGYFGAAAGVMILALLLSTTDKALLTANATKNLLLGVANATAAVGFVFFADVRWAAVVPLAVGCLAGGAIGPAIIRHLPAALVRTVVGVAGLALSVKLALT
jgi:uncharacterized membrane protein YfcA